MASNTGIDKTIVGMPQVVALLINWNGWKDTIECLASLLTVDYPCLSVIIVDNGSRDRSVEMIKGWSQSKNCRVEAYRWDAVKQSLEPEGVYACGGSRMRIQLIALGENVGFCAGNNLGMRHAFEQHAEYCLVLNNDTIVEPTSITRLVKAVEADHTIGLASPFICYYDESEKIWWAGGEFSRYMRPVYRGQGLVRGTLGCEGVQESSWASGCAMLVSKPLFGQIGGFDETFFIWCEEWDYSLRARKEGFKIVAVHDSVIYHKVGRSLQWVSPLTLYYGGRNMVLLRKKHLPFLTWTVLSALTFLRKMWQGVSLSIRTGNALYWLAAVDIVYDILKGNSGKWARQSN